MKNSKMKAKPMAKKPGAKKMPFGPRGAKAVVAGGGGGKTVAR